MKRVILSLLAITALAAENGPDPLSRTEEAHRLVVVDGRFVSYIGKQPLLLDPELRKRSPETYREAVDAFGPAFTPRASSAGVWEWHFEDGRMYRLIGCWNQHELDDAVDLHLRESTRWEAVDAPEIEAEKPRPSSDERSESK